MSVHVLPITASMGGTLTPLIRTYLTRRRRQGTYRAESLRTVGPRLASLDASFGRRPLDQLGRRAIERWLEGLEHLAVNSRASYLASVRKFTHWLAVEGHIRVDPCPEIDRITRPRSVPRAQSEDAVAALLAVAIDQRERAVIWLMVGLGLRRGEVAGLRWQDYDDHAGVLLVVEGKGGHERVLPVSTEVARALTLIRTAATGPIIRSKHDDLSPVLPATIGAWLTRACWRAGIKHGAYDGVSGHALRHTAASDVLDRGADLRTVQAMLGHQSLQSTSIYLRRADAEKMRPAMEGRTYRAEAA